jgi:ParB/RepB/Spo0J family partition protein
LSLKLVTIPIDQIKVEEGHNPRSSMDAEDLKDLSRSIESQGLLSPISVRANDSGYYIVAGERRYRAASLAGLKEIPAYIREDEDDQAYAIALIENLQRTDLTVGEEAEGYRRLRDERKWTVAKIAQETGFKQSRIQERLSLLDVPEEARQGVSELSKHNRSLWTSLAAFKELHAGIIDCAKREILQGIQDPQAFFRHAASGSENWPMVATNRAISLYGEGVDFWFPPQVHTEPQEVQNEDGETETVEVEVKTRHEVVELAQTWEVYDVELTDGDFQKALGMQSAVSLKGQTKDAQPLQLIVGFELCQQLLADRVKKAAQREKRDYKKQVEEQGGDGAAAVKEIETGETNRPTYSGPTDTPEQRAEQAKEKAKETRDQSKVDKEAAIPFNEKLSKKLLEKGAEVEPTASALRLVCLMALDDHVDDYALRGFRFVHPNGKGVEKTEKTGKEKTVHKEGSEAIELVTDFVLGAKQPAEILGRTLIVLLSAVYADQREVAQSNRRGFGPSPRYFKEQVKQEVERLAKRLLGSALYEEAIEHAKGASQSYGSEIHSKGFGAAS